MKLRYFLVLFLFTCCSFARPKGRISGACERTCAGSNRQQVDQIRRTMEVFERYQQ